MIVRTSCSLFLLLGLFAAQSPAQVYRLIDLGPWFAVAINDSDHILLAQQGIPYPYIWRNGVVAPLGEMVFGGGSSAHAINNVSQIAGEAQSVPGNPQSVHAFRWENFVFTDLGTLGGTHANALAINNLGHVVGFGPVVDTLPYRGFYWHDGVMTQLDGFIPGKWTAAQGINDSGQIVGNADNEQNLPQAVMWYNGGITQLGTLGGSSSYAVGINNAGQIIGSSTRNESSNPIGFIWQNGSMISMGQIAIPPGSVVGYSDPYGLNDSGEVVGQSTWDADLLTHNLHAFIWRNGVMTDLNSLTDTSSNWELIRGVGINNHGNILATAAYYSTPRAVLLKKTDIILTSPTGGERWTSGDQDTIRWLSGLGQNAQVILWYSLNGGQTWRLIDNSIPASSEEYVWTIPDTLSTRVRVMVQSQTEPTKSDTSDLFRMKGYVLTKFSSTGDYIAYNPAVDRWGLGNFPQDVWPATWYNRFNYQGIDPFTGLSYLAGGMEVSDAFRNAHSNHFPDWPAFVDAFQTWQCYVYTLNNVYSPTAVMRWKSINDSWGGSCFGLAISNAWAFRERATFLGTYTHFPNYGTPIQVHSDTNVIPVINSLFIHQFGNPHSSYINNAWGSKTPNQTLADLKAMLVSDDEPVRSLTIFNNGPGGGGHAILAHKLRRDPAQGHLYHLSVYDNSYPTETSAEIVFDTTAFAGQGGWTYGLWPGWGGPKGIFLMDPAVDYVNPPQLSRVVPENRISVFSLPDTIVNIHIGPKSEILIRDGAGNITGYADSVIRAEIPGSVPLTVQNGSKRPPYGYWMTVRPYSVTLQEFTDTLSRAYFFTGERSFSVERGGATSTQTDRFAFDGNISITNPDACSKSYNIVNIVSEFVQSREKLFSIRSLSLTEHDSVRLANVNTDGLKLSSFNPSVKTYRLTIENYVWTGLRQFTHDGVVLDGNSSHIIRPDWNSITPSTQVTILIDHGNDGTVDDSMMVDNQITGTEDLFGGIPSEFQLHQNYPNPFNPITTIAYDLPKVAHVVLAVYNVLGQQVAVLVDGVQEAGYKTVEWNASTVPSGVYFYRLQARQTDGGQAGEFSRIRKMLLVR
jgi:probable HAF family extracellular repeat protein